MAGSGFGLDNLPYGVSSEGHVVVAVGSNVVDLALLDGLEGGDGLWASGSLNAFMALGPPAWSATRQRLMTLLGLGSQPRPGAVRPAADVELVLAWEVGDYVDFYASEAHAINMGRMLRPGSEPLPPAWRHLPMGYHGRSSTVVVSGSPVCRPLGVVGPGVATTTGRLDVEVEVGFVVGVGSERGVPVAGARAGDHVFGVVLLNDWSARDIQAFECVPLGPLCGKSFATSVSPWVVPLASLAPWRVPGPQQIPLPAEFLRVDEPRNLDVHLELSLNGTVVSQTGTADLYWAMAQQLAHLTLNGTALRTGDLFATGTVSGTAPGTAGSLMELAGNGAHPVPLADGSSRAWLADGDTATIRGWCGSPDGPWLSLGSVSGTVVPAREVGTLVPAREAGTVVPAREG